MSSTNMTIGMVGLGRMGSNLVRRLVAHGGSAVVSDTDPHVAEALAKELGGQVTPAGDLKAMVQGLPEPRIVWVMVPAGVTGGVIEELGAILGDGDIIIDGGNSDWRHDRDRAARLAEIGVELIDAGTSGGVWGLDRGYCLMVGGSDDAVQRASAVFDALSPDFDSVERTAGRSGKPAPAENGWLHCGPNGAGHFVKMVHNGIEYGLMAAYAEGFNLLDHSGPYGFDIDVAAVSEVWRRGSVIGSWLLDLTASAMADSDGISEFSGYVSDSGEGRWTLEAGIDLAVPMPVLAGALFSRFSSRDEDHRANQVLSAMRNQFGGHVEPAHPTANDPDPAGFPPAQAGDEQ